MAHAVVHFEVTGKDLDKLNSFYAELFGWKTQKVPGDMPYAMVEKEVGGIGGGYPGAQLGVGQRPLELRRGRTLLRRTLGRANADRLPAAVNRAVVENVLAVLRGERPPGLVNADLARR